MNYLFLNTEIPPILLDGRLGRFEVCTRILGSSNVNVVYDAREWSSEPIYQESNKILVLAGWFVLDGAKNDLKKLYDRIQSAGIGEAINQVDLGVFFGAYFDGVNLFLFNDLLGLSNHFVMEKAEEDLVQIAPFVSVLAIDSSQIIPGVLNDFKYYHHTFGDKTLYPHVSRFKPGSVYERRSGSKIYFRFRPENQVPVSSFQSITKEIVELWPYEYRSIALSSGFDARFIFASSKFKYSYTWGPSSSRDCAVAKQLVDLKGAPDSHHFEFAFVQEVPSFLKAFNSFASLGMMDIPDEHFIGGYYRANELMGEGYVAFDGFLGDVLQRGTYASMKGWQGELFGLFPAFYKLFNISPEKIIRSRYPKANTDELINAYYSFIHEYDLPKTLNSFTFFEILNGRGTKYIINGGIILNGVFKVSVPVFMHRKILETFLKSDSYETVNFKLFKRFWVNVDDQLKHLNSEHFYSLKTPRWLIPFVKFIGRVLVNFIPTFYNYGKEHLLKKT